MFRKPHQETLILQSLQERLFKSLTATKIHFYCRIEVEDHIIKKNNRPIWRGRLGKSPRLRKAEKHMIDSFIHEKVRCNILEPISTPVWMLALFHCADFYVKPKRKTDAPRMSLTLGDLSNLYQLPEDCLVEAGILANDALICSHDGSRKLPSLTGENYLELFLLDCNPNF